MSAAELYLLIMLPLIVAFGVLDQVVERRWRRMLLDSARKEIEEEQKR